MAVWLKIAHDHWLSVGVNEQSSRVNPRLVDYHRAFQHKCFRYRTQRGYRARLALIVLGDVFHRLAIGEFGY